MNEVLGQIHFWPSLIFMNAVFMPMFIQGLAGVSRRLYDAGASYDLAQGTLHLNKDISYAAWLLGVSQIPFIINLLWSMFKGPKVTNDNPWEATTIEWAAPSPPGHWNFKQPIEVFRGPYEYSVPGAKQDYTPQYQKEVN